MRIGIISERGGSSTELLVVRGKELGITVLPLALAEMQLVFGKGSGLKLSGRKVEDFQVLLIRGIGGREQELELVLEHAGQKNIRVVDKGLYRVRQGSGSKGLTCLKLTQAGIPYLPTFFFNRFTEIDGQLLGSAPWIMKHVAGRQGNWVFKVNSEKEIVKIMGKKEGMWMLQPFVEAEGDYRVICLGDKALGAMQRKPCRKGEFLSNISRGGQGMKADLPKKVLQLAVKASQACGWEFAGVDLLFDEERKRWWVLEVNRAPQFAGFMKATGIDVAESVLAYLQQIEKRRAK